MSSPAYGFAYHFWRRHRWGFGLFLTGLFAASLLAHTVAAGQAEASDGLAIPLILGLLYLLTVFTYSDSDIASGGSGFPSYLLVLPLRTRDLVLWPILFGTVLVALGWIALALLVLHPLGIPAAVAWPAAMFAALQVCVQALFWTPYAHPALRLLLTVTLLPLLVILGLLHDLCGLSVPMLIAVYLAVIGIASQMALRGLTHARRGEGMEGASSREEPAREDRTAPRIEPPFASPAQAQFWAEWKQNGRMLPLLMAGLCFFFSVPLFFVGDLLPLDMTRPLGQPGTGAGSILVNGWLRTIENCLLLPVLLAAIVGSGARRSDTRRKERTLHLFLATRPMTSAEMVGVKLKAAARSALSVWGVMGLFAVAWLLFPARDGETTGPLLFLLLRYVTLQNVITAFVYLSFLALWTWRSQIVSLFADLSGRSWLVYGYPSVMSSLLLFTFTSFIHWASNLQADMRYVNCPPFIPLAAYTALAVKFVWSGWAMRALLRRGLMEARTLLKIVLIWLLTAAILFLLLVWFGPREWPLLPSFGDPEVVFSNRNLAIGVVLFLPLARLLSAPLALDWNRHR